MTFDLQCNRTLLPNGADLACTIGVTNGGGRIKTDSVQISLNAFVNLNGGRSLFTHAFDTNHKRTKS